ncbi:hypothetical protein TPSD3_01325 [Thioflexithrix psekupsensis]|uniref:Uncharacterized protein n=1 Tax=Thioflexithrix psekupsensis TaxID=1570016 RepID=A0A251X4F1_9GAMM|nr:hypothetical protein TPSD3_17035 [Thioflexithrix psekupsensis]OUD15934.1 hypothetical protein TPSD3_01325 [Thioflexithrix psekupsensis]
MIALLLIFLWTTHRHAAEIAENTTRNLTELLALRIVSDLDRVNGMLTYIAEEAIAASLLEQGLTPPYLNTRRMASLIANFDTVTGIYQFDAQGQLHFASQETPSFNIPKLCEI